MESSVVEMSKVLTNYMSTKKDQSSTVTTSQPLKFDYIWRNLDQLFQQMSQDQVNDLNRQFMNLAFQKLEEKS